LPQDWRGPHGQEDDKAESTCGGSDAMQAKGKKLGQTVSMKNLKGAYFEVEFHEKLQRV